jgi:XTP/dITP diphosphohydrolase
MIRLVTSNPLKALEISQALKPYGIGLKPEAIEIDEIQSLSIEAVVRHKVEQAYNLIKAPVLVDDTGIFFTGYKQFPGVLSRYVAMSLGFKGLFKLIKSGQHAYFCSYIAFKASARAKPVVFRGVCRGRLVRTIRGPRKITMPYDNISIPTGDSRTFAEMGVTDKQKYDHRAKAVRLFAKYYQQHYL